MSAYALPGLFPPLEYTYTFTPCNTCPLGSVDKEEKVEFEPLMLDQQACSVSVKDARVDPVRLIQSITKKTGSSSLSRKSARRNLRRRNSDPFPSASYPPHEEAMQFELDIRHNGRHYTAVRSLARIRQLSRDLSKELGCKDPRSTLENVSRGYNVKIPDLSPLNYDCKSLGFTLLQDVLRVYAPGLEAWFDQVLAYFPCPDDSMSLTDFFYEPADDQPILRWEKVLRHQLSLPTKLDAIEESDEE